jgi:hypothetical protein
MSTPINQPLDEVDSEDLVRKYVTMLLLFWPFSLPLESTSTLLFLVRLKREHDGVDRELLERVHSSCPFKVNTVRYILMSVNRFLPN